MGDHEFYRRQSRLTHPGAKRYLFAGLPTDIVGMLKVIGGVMVHRDMTRLFGFALPEPRREEANTRHVEAILTHLGTLEERRPEDRFAGTCRDFTVLLCAMLRAAGVPARARAGFAGYFTDGFLTDHWVAEVWDDDRGWRLIDAQVASAGKGVYTAAEIDPLDVPRDAFLVAGQAWRECRAGRLDPDRIGVVAAHLTGMWEIQGNVVRDLASLNSVEALPWDVWGLIDVHHDQLPPADIGLLDRIAAVSAAGGPLNQAADAYRGDPRLPAPAPLTSRAGSHQPG